MRIGYISTYPPLECGIATYTQALVDAVERLDHETFVASFHGAEGHRVFPVVAGNDSPTIADDLFRTCSKLTPDLVHVQHEYGLFGPQKGAAVCDLLVRFRIARIPVVTTLHTVYETLSHEQETVLRHIVADSEAVIVHEAFQKETIERAFGPQDKVHVIEHGVRELSPIADAKARLGFSGRKVVMLCGYFRKSKGFHKAAAFLPALCEADPDVVLVMAGKVRGVEALEYQRELFDLMLASPYRDRIEFLRGQFPQQTFDMMLSAADVIVLPYDVGAQSGMVSHCLALRRPFVTSDLPAFRAIVERTGAGLVAENEDYATAILRLLHDESLRSRAIANAARYVQSRAGWSHIAAQHESVYEQVIEPYGFGRYIYVPPHSSVPLHSVRGNGEVPGDAGTSNASRHDEVPAAVEGVAVPTPYATESAFLGVDGAGGFSPPVHIADLRHDGRPRNGSRGLDSIPR